MHQLYKLKDRLCEELGAFADRDISSSNLEMIDKLAHATKNIGKVIEMKDEEEYSNRMSYGNSYARGRGRNAKRDSMGRYASDGYSRDGYSRDNEFVGEIRQIAAALPHEQRNAIEDILTRMDRM